MRKIGSFFLTLIICIAVALIIVFSLNYAGIITLPEDFSLKQYFSNTMEVMGFGEEKIYYPDYDGTGIQDLVVDEKVAKATIENNNSKDEYVEIGSIASLANNTDTKIEENANVYIPTAANVTDNSYYYNQLDTYGKTIYSRLYSNLDNLKSGDYTVDFGVTFNELLQKEEGDMILTNAFQLSINALLLDHPEIFYLDVTKMFMFTESTTTIRGTTYKISIGPDSGISYLTEGFNSKADILIAEDNLNTVLYAIKSSLNGDIYEQIKQVHNYLIDNTNYDQENESDISHGIYGALINKVAVCDGYAKAFKYVLDQLGISCVEICGTAQNSSGYIESHAWNDVLINGNWYAIDVTWDDPIIIGGNGKLSNELRYSYFLKGSDEFFSSHTEDGYIVDNGEFMYPVISKSSF